MKTFGYFALALVALSFLLWVGGWIYWNFIYTMAEYWSTTYILMVGVSLLAGVSGFLAIVCLAIGLVIGPKSPASG